MLFLSLYDRHYKINYDKFRNVHYLYIPHNNTHSELCTYHSQDCPPVSPNPATTPDFDNFTITVSGFNSVSTPYCQYEQPISEEKDYDITVTIDNIVGSSEPTTTQFGRRSS